MSKLTKSIGVGILFITVVTVITIQMMKQEHSNSEATINKDIMLIKSFTIDAAASNLQTSAKGTISISENKGIAEGLQIIAFIEIDPDDWGGVAFYIPQNWKISNIFSSYPEEDTSNDQSKYITTWSTEAVVQNDWNKRVEIGRDRSYIPSKGGSGTVVIDIVAEEDHPQTDLESIIIGIEVGSSDEGNYKVMGTDSITVPLLLKKN